MKIRVCFGYDVHQLEEGSDFWLGGINIPHTKGAIGHSDADALIHAICDAILGAAKLGDIGKHFPPNEQEYLDADSRDLLKKVGEMLNEEGYRLGNIDSTVCLEEPKIAPYIDKMESEIAQALGISSDQVSVKATTSEKMGFVGRGEGLTAYAVVLIEAATNPSAY